MIFSEFSGFSELCRIEGQYGTRDIQYLTTDTFLDVAVKNNFPLLLVGWYLFKAVSGNRGLPRGSNETTLWITAVALVMYLLPDG